MPLSPPPCTNFQPTLYSFCIHFRPPHLTHYLSANASHIPFVDSKSFRYHLPDHVIGPPPPRSSSSGPLTFPSTIAIFSSANTSTRLPPLPLLCFQMLAASSSLHPPAPHTAVSSLTPGTAGSQTLRARNKHMEF